MSFGISRGKQLDTTGYGLTTADLPAFDAGDPEASRIDPRNWFTEPSRPLEIEIGSGKGTFLVQQAPLKPEINFLGIEWAKEFYTYAADRFRRREVANARMLHADATEFVRFFCPGCVASVIHLYFSDPWPKKRHHKRRVMQDATLEQFHRILQPEGQLRLVTDHDDLWQWYEEHIERNSHLFACQPFAAPKSAGEGEIVGTNYERKFSQEGRPFHAVTLVRA